MGFGEEAFLKLLLGRGVREDLVVIVPEGVEVECGGFGGDYDEEDDVTIFGITHLARILLPSLSRMRSPFTVSRVGSSSTFSRVILS